MGQNSPNETLAADELVFPVRWPMEVPGYIISGIGLVAALALGVSPALREQLGVGVWVAWLIGAVALFFAEESFRISSYKLPRWVGVSQSGIRWYQSFQIHSRPWSDFSRIQRTDNHFYYNGQYSDTIQVFVLEFRSGERLPLCPHHVRHFNHLISAIQNRGALFYTPPAEGTAPALAQPCDRIGW